MEYRTIVQVSPIRSGSTLVYNMLKQIFPTKAVSKNHTCVLNGANFYVITLRHPYNSIISNIERSETAIDDEVLKRNTHEYLVNGGHFIINNDLNRENCLVLYYEDFVNHFDHVYSMIEKTMKMSIPEEVKHRINNRFNIESVEEFVRRFENFSQYDHATHLHGKHISRYRGQTDYTKILTPSQIHLLKENEHLNTIIETYFKDKVLGPPKRKLM